MPTEYFQDEPLTDMVSGVISNTTYTEFEPLRDQNLTFLCAFVLKTDKNEEEKPTSGDVVVIKKVPQADRPFMTGDYKLYVDRSRWNEANEKQQEALLHRALMRIEVEVVSGKPTKLTVRKPDVAEFQTTVVRFGAWTDNLITLRDNLQAAQAKNAARNKT
jgi:hypothetical protein